MHAKQMKQKVKKNSSNHKTAASKTAVAQQQ